MPRTRGTTAAGERGVDGVVLISVDSLRADEVYGDGPDLPAVGGLVDGGTAFENAFAHGNWTPFSFPSILGGSHAFDGTGTLGPGPGATLAETLRDAGVETAGYNAANGFLAPYWGYDRGFDDFESFLDDPATSLSGRYLAAHPTVAGWLQYLSAKTRRTLTGLLGGSDRGPIDVSRGRDVERRAIDFLGSVEGPFFLWIHFMDAHIPYLPGPRYLQEALDGPIDWTETIVAQLRASLGWTLSEDSLGRLRSLYRGGLRQVDDSVGRILDALDRRGLRDTTAVIVAGDHGEEFGEHGHLAHYPKLYDELVHVPLVVDRPGTDGGRVSPPVGLDVVPPTVCDLLGVPAGAFPGRSVGGTVRRGRDPEPEPVVSIAVRGETVTQQPIPRHPGEGEVIASARSADLTYIHHAESGDEEVYDRTRDPGEQRPIGPGRVAPARIEPLRRAVADRLAGLEDGDGDPSSAPDSVESRLAALGYR